MTAPLWAQLATARHLDLSHPYRVGMPQSPNHPPYRMLLERRHGDVMRTDGGSAANEIVMLGGHVGTHIDALAHVSHDGLLYGGVRAAEITTHRGFERLGVDDVPIVAGRAVLLDITAVHGLDVLPAGYEITVEDLETARARAGVDLLAGDVVLLGTGWSRHWADVETFTGQKAGVPGPGEAAGRWLVGHQPVIVGSESIAFEQIKAGQGHALLPVHRLMLVENGIHIMETMNLTELIAAGATEFAVVLSGLNFAGATGSPVRPVALLGPESAQ